MVRSLLATAGGLLLLFSFSSAQIRGDNLDICTQNDGFGKYCPTTCGVADYLLKYMPPVNRDLDEMHKQLLNIANLTHGAENDANIMKDSSTQAQKSSADGNFKRSSSMLDDVLRYEKTILEQENQIFELQNLVTANERRMTDLKQLSLQLQQTCTESCKDTVEIQPTTGTDCQDVANKGATTSGLYYLKPTAAPTPFLAYCEIDNFGRGFTVIQRRRDGSVDFKKDWVQYKEGFGYFSPDDTTEFWLGNEKIHHLTATTDNIPIVLRIELVDWAGNKKYADYTMFKVGSESDMYRLGHGYYIGGDAGDAFAGFDFGDDPSDKHYTSHMGMQFSTPDKDNDKYDGNCAQQDGSGWWMNRCHAAHLNGRYYSGGIYSEKDAGEHGYDNGIIWVTWHNRWYSLKETTMKIIPVTRLQTGGQQSGVKDFGGLGV